MTYSETRGEPPFNWLEALKPGLSYNYLIELHRLSSKWPTCACGNQCSIIPRWSESEGGMVGEPKDLKLSELGYAFNHCIVHARYYAEDNELEARDRCIEEARDTFLQIEQRANELIKSNV